MKNKGENMYKDENNNIKLMKWDIEFKSFDDYKEVEPIMKLILAVESLFESAVFFLMTGQPDLIELSKKYRDEAMYLYNEVIKPKIEHDKITHGDIISRIKKLDKEIEGIGDEYFS